VSEEKKKIDRVVGLHYEPGEGLPQVIVKGSGAQAREIIDRAKKLRGGPQVVKDEALLGKLYRLPIDAEIGPELFQLVAILLAHVFSIEKNLETKQSG
jgi:flagellar biosynthesis protein